MSASVLAIKVLSALLLPPLSLILLCAIGLWLRRKRPCAGLALSGVALTALAAMSTLAGALLLLTPLENRSPPVISAQDSGAQAIVVLGGGRLLNAPEYSGRDMPSHQTLMRLRYAAKLHRKTGLPLLVSGGAPEGAGEPEAVLMARSLAEDFAVPVQWIEDRSFDTAQNAAFSAPLLMQADVRRILLVTDGVHMPRSRAVFERAGMEVIPAPTALWSHAPLTPIDFLPSGEGLRRSHYALHEWIGIAWYRYKLWSTS
jgi:uncharacterized SAM-binding protein YcdF (DUF218 family)